jgi:hypothetical protein
MQQKEIVPSFSLVTINILNDLSLWMERGPLLVEQLAELDPDLIAMQEVRLQGESSNAHWIAEQLNQCKNPILSSSGLSQDRDLCKEGGDCNSQSFSSETS